MRKSTAFWLIALPVSLFVTLLFWPPVAAILALVTLAVSVGISIEGLIRS